MACLQIRQAQVIEAIDLIRKLWSGEAVTYRGDHYQTQKAKLYTLCDKKIPIFVSAITPASARFAGTYGDGLITVGGKDPSSYHEMLKNFAAGATDAGKDTQSLPRMIELAVDFAADVDKAIEARKAYWAATFIPALFTQRIYTPTMAEQNGAAVGSDTVRQSVCISADTRSARAQCPALLGSGIRSPDFSFSRPGSIFVPAGLWALGLTAPACHPSCLTRAISRTTRESLKRWT